jgi:hypothetical protein
VRLRPVVLTARLLAAAGLAVDAYVHADLAPQYDVVKDTFTQGGLFRVEAAVAALAALLVLVWRRLPADLFAWAVAAGGFALIIIYRYVDVGSFGPVPNMYEPDWFTDKWVAAVAQLVTVAAASLLIVSDLVDMRARRHRTRVR